MNNAMIIANEAVASGFYTEEEVKKLISEGRDIQFHTCAVWRDRYNMVPVKGSRGWETWLWRKKNKNSRTDKEESEKSEIGIDFYLARSFLFHITQCRPISSENP